MVIAPEFPPAVGGMEVHAARLVRALAQRHRLDVLVPRASSGIPAGDVVLHPVLDRRFAPSLRRAAKLVRTCRPDAVLALNAGYGVLGEMLDPPVVARVVGNDFERAWIGPHLPGRFLFWRLPAEGRFSPGGWLRRADQRRRNHAAVSGLRSCRVILANSAWTREALVRLGVSGPDLRVVLGGVDLERFRPRDAAAERAGLGLPPGPILFSAARLTRKKGFDLLLEALPGLVRSHPDLLLVLAGSGEEEEPLRGLARRIGIEDRVRFLGTVDHADLPRYMAAADVYLQPSRRSRDPRDGSVDVETMGRAVCEAAACGRPGVVSASGGLPDIVVDGGTGLVIPEEDAEALGAAVARLLGDPGLRERLGTAALARARRLFGWDTVARRTEEALADACAAPPVPQAGGGSPERAPSRSR